MQMPLATSSMTSVSGATKIHQRSSTTTTRPAIVNLSSTKVVEATATVSRLHSDVKASVSTPETPDQKAECLSRLRRLLARTKSCLQELFED